MEATKDIVKLLWPNNRMTLTSKEEMAERGMALNCLGPISIYGNQEAWFVDIFGRNEVHFITPDRLQTNPPHKP